MSYDSDIAQAYREVRTAKRWKKERESVRWKLAQECATSKLPLNGPAVLCHATTISNVGKRSVFKQK